MPLWGFTDANTAAPKMRYILPKNPTRGPVLYGNTTPGAFASASAIANSQQRAIGVFGEDGNEAAKLRLHNLPRPAHAGWVKVIQNVGPLVGLTKTAPGSGYSNTDFIKVTSSVANSVFASANIVTDNIGAIVSTNITSGGFKFTNVASLTVAIRNTGDTGASAGSGATFTPVLGGRAGRVQMETLVAGGSMTLDGSDNALFPNT